jgi:hypothetical protein
MKLIRAVAPLLAGAFVMCASIAIAKSTAHLMATSVYTTEDSAATGMLAYTPDYNSSPPSLKAKYGSEVTVLERVPPHVWFYKYASMREWGITHGRQMVKAPDDSDEDWLVKIQLPDGTKAWVTSSELDPPH